jgi:hypothetical protein
MPRDKVLQLDQEAHLKALRRRLQLEAAGLDPDAAHPPAPHLKSSAARKAKRAGASEAADETFCTSLDGPVCPLPTAEVYSIGRRNPYEPASASSSSDDNDDEEDIYAALEDDDDASLTKMEKIEKEVQRQMKKVLKAEKELAAKVAGTMGKMAAAKPGVVGNAADAADADADGPDDAAAEATGWRTIGGGDEKDATKTGANFKSRKSKLASPKHASKEKDVGGENKVTKRNKGLDGPGGDGSGGAGMSRLDSAILEAAADVRCDVCRALARNVFTQSSEATRGGTTDISEENVFKQAHRACTGQVPPLLHHYSIVPRPNAEAESLDDDDKRAAARFVLGERDGHTTLTNFEASAFKKACMAVVQEVDDELAERTYVAVRERWADVAKLPKGASSTARDLAQKKARAKQVAAGEAAGLEFPGEGDGGEGGGSEGGGGGKPGKKEKEKAAEAAQGRNHILFKLQRAVCDKNPVVCPAGGSGGAAALLSSAKSKKKKPPAVEELLRKSGAGGKGCVYSHTGWWTYEVCYGETITQYHVDHPYVADAVSLGVFDEGATAAAVEPRVPYLDAQDMLPGMVKRARYFQLSYTGGAYCEGVKDGEAPNKSGRRVARRSTVQYACSPDGLEHVMVREPSTCKYVITVFLPAMCSHAQFTLQENML